MILFRFITDRWDAQRRAKIEQSTQKIAEDILMSAIDAAEFSDRDVERLKMKVARILLREEMSDSWKSPHKGEEISSDWKPPHKREEMSDTWKPPHKGDKNDDYRASGDSLSKR